MAFLVAPATPALIFVALAALANAPLASVWPMLALVSVVTYAHALVLGLPVAWLLNRSSSLTLLRVVVAAFLIGALPFGALTLYQEATIPRGAGYSENGVVLRDDGRLTPAGVKNAVLGVLELGGLGLAAGIIWWLIARPRKVAA